MTNFRLPKWGFVEIIIVYIGIILIGFIFGMSEDIVNRLLEILRLPDTVLSYFYLGFAVQFLATVSLVLIMTVWLNRATLDDIGLKNVTLNEYIKYGLVGGLVLIVVIVTLGLPISYFHPDLEPQLYEDMLRSVSDTKDFVLLFILGAILAPLSEELFYRGMIYPVFRKKFKVIPAIIFAGILFGLAHWDLWRTIPLAAGGMILCYLYEKTQSIFVTTLAHGIWNGVMSLVVYYSMINNL